MYNQSWLQKMQAYKALCKPRVVALMILTSIVGMQLAVPGLVPWKILVFANMGIALMSFGAAAINHIIDAHYDARMRRTCHRPLPAEQLNRQQASLFALALSLTGFLILLTQINFLTAFLTLLTFIGYAFIYTAFLKHLTPQNIVIGGLSGAMPPLLGYTAVAGVLTPQAGLLTLLIFVWTPPHFWALAIHRFEDYARADIPMLPNTHGIIYTKLHILLYTLLLGVISFLPFCIGMSGKIYLIGIIILNSRFIYLAVKLYLEKNQHTKTAFQIFKFSIIYLMWMYILLLFDHWL